jgi:hypothetical protein
MGMIKKFISENVILDCISLAQQKILGACRT